MAITVARIYGREAVPGAALFFVERLWPRGISKVSMADVQWVKAIAPTTELRKWFNHIPERWGEFQARYRAELAPQGEALRPLVEAAKAGDVVLYYSARDTVMNGAIVLKAVLEEMVAEDE